MVGVIAGRYEPGAVLGSGGMARVVEATDLRLGRRVALKLLDVAAADAATRERFVREARSAASFTHPNAVTVYDAGEESGLLYIAMELVDGPTLAGVLTDRGPLDAEEAVNLAIQVLGALEAGHARGLVHRDVKPANVLLAPDGSAKLADFGIAKSVDAVTAALTMTGQVIGTPRYLSPEQAAGREATPASDLYSVGLVLYEMLAGEPPFVGDTPMATALAHQQAPVPPLAERRPGLDPGLAAVVERALAKAPTDRYRDAAAMRVALASSGAAPVAAAQETTERGPRAVPPTERMQVPPDGRQHRRWVIGLLAGIGLLLAGVLLAALIDWEGEPTRVIEAPRPTSTSTSTTTTTAPPGPATIGELADLVASGPPEAYGEKGKDLLERLQKVQREEPDKRAEETEKAIEEISKWVEEGELDPEIAQTAIALLEASI